MSEKNKSAFDEFLNSNKFLGPKSLALGCIVICGAALSAAILQDWKDAADRYNDCREDFNKQLNEWAASPSEAQYLYGGLCRTSGGLLSSSQKLETYVCSKERFCFVIDLTDNFSSAISDEEMRDIIFDKAANGASIRSGYEFGEPKY